MKIFILRCFFVLFLFAIDSLAGITLDSKKVSFDRISGIISASGGVIITQELSSGIREMHCEKIEYNKNTKQLKLFGDFLIKEPTGEIAHAKDAEIDLKLKQAIIKALKVVLADSSRIKAETGTKDDKVYTFSNANYTPCKETGCSLPLWDFQAEKVVYDTSKKSFVYHNVKLRLKGYTIAYLPYFKHPTFGVKRQSGFLAPIISSNNDTGLFIGIPYFVTLGNDKDLRLTPFLNTHNRAFVSGRYRQSMPNADLIAGGSFLSKAKKRRNTSQEELHNRYHFDMLFQSYNIENKRVTLKVERASDVTYKIKYPVSDDHLGNVIKKKTTESKLAFDLFDRNYFATVSSYIFQTPDKDLQPTIIPHFNLNYIPENISNGTAEIDSDIFCLVRDSSKIPGSDNQLFRTSNRINWSKNFSFSPILFDISSAIRIDTYNAEQEIKRQNEIYPALENQFNAFLPLKSDVSKNLHSIWGPKIALSSTETFNNRKQLNINEDSIFQSFDDLNLFNLNRFGGYDKIENGERISIGVENSVYNSKRRVLNFFIGKSQELGKRNDFKTRNSIVGRFCIKPSESLSLRTRFVGLPFASRAKMFESGANLEIKQISAGIGYTYDSRKNYFRDATISQIGMSIGVKVSKCWGIKTSQILNLKKWMGHRNLSRTLFLDYKDECFGICCGIYKSKYKDKDISPKTGVIITILFKNLGNLGENASKHLYKSSFGIVE